MQENRPPNESWDRHRPSYILSILFPGFARPRAFRCVGITKAALIRLHLANLEVPDHLGFDSQGESDHSTPPLYSHESGAICALLLDPGDKRAIPDSLPIDSDLRSDSHTPLLDPWTSFAPYTSFSDLDELRDRYSSFRNPKSADNHWSVRAPEKRFERKTDTHVVPTNTQWAPNLRKALGVRSHRPKRRLPQNYLIPPLILATTPSPLQLKGCGRLYYTGLYT